MLPSLFALCLTLYSVSLDSCKYRKCASTSLPPHLFLQEQDEISFHFKLTGLLEPHSLMKVVSGTSYNFTEDILTFASTEGCNDGVALQKLSSLRAVRSKATTSTLLCELCVIRKNTVHECSGFVGVFLGFF